MTKEQPWLLAVGGQPRSGTSMLWAICNSHPDIHLSFEFRNFAKLGESYADNLARLRKSWWKWDLAGNRHGNRKVIHKAHSAVFLARYLHKFRRFSGETIQASHVREVLAEMWSDSKIVGDKFPPYVHRLHNLVRHDHMYRVIIYRDCRDVVQSTLKKADTSWKDKHFIKQLNTPEKVARRWIKAIEKMEKFGAEIHIIRYEELVTDPKPVLDGLATYLNVDACQFDPHIVRSTSIGKYEHGLSDEQLEPIMDIAGPTLTRLGYL
jgi:hypothetical protein